jgi:hypothetical protein
MYNNEAGSAMVTGSKRVFLRERGILKNYHRNSEQVAKRMRQNMNGSDLNVYTCDAESANSIGPSMDSRGSGRGSSNGGGWIGSGGIESSTATSSHSSGDAESSTATSSHSSGCAESSAATSGHSSGGAGSSAATSGHSSGGAGSSAATSGHSSEGAGSRAATSSHISGVGGDGSGSGGVSRRMRTDDIDAAEKSFIIEWGKAVKVKGDNVEKIDLQRAYWVRFPGSNRHGSELQSVWSKWLGNQKKGKTGWYKELPKLQRK